LRGGCGGYYLLGGYYEQVNMSVSDHQLLPDKIAKALFNLRMTWYGSLLSIPWVSIYVVFFAMTFQITTCIDELPDIISPLHTISNAISLVFASGWSLDYSSSIMS